MFDFFRDERKYDFLVVKYGKVGECGRGVLW